MTTFYVKEAYTEETTGADGEIHGYRLNDPEIREHVTPDIRTLYHDLVVMHGRCTGYVYIGDGQKVGWTFLKRVPYDDARTHRTPKGKYAYNPKDTYWQVVWVTVYDAPPTVVTTYHYHQFDAAKSEVV